MSLEHEDAMQEMRDGKCKWRLLIGMHLADDRWLSSCGFYNDIELPDLKKTCPSCGREIEVMK